MTIFTLFKLTIWSNRRRPRSPWGYSDESRLVPSTCAILQCVLSCRFAGPAGSVLFYRCNISEVSCDARKSRRMLYSINAPLPHKKDLQMCHVIMYVCLLYASSSVGRFGNLLGEDVKAGSDWCTVWFWMISNHHKRKCLRPFIQVLNDRVGLRHGMTWHFMLFHTLSRCRIVYIVCLTRCLYCSQWYWYLIL